MNNITREMVYRLLTNLVTPEFNDYIKDYGIIVRKNHMGDFIAVRVFLDKAKISSLDDNEYVTFRGRIITSIKQVLKYLSPSSTEINFSVID